MYSIFVVCDNSFFQTSSQKKEKKKKSHISKK